MVLFKIFVSYNPNVEIEQSTALRLQTLSSLYDAMVYLPDRLGSTSLKESTKSNILDSQVFVMFSTRRLSQPVLDEVNFALQHEKKVVIFYDKILGKNINTSGIKNKNLYETQFDPRKDDTPYILKTVMEQGGFINHQSPEAKKTNKGIGALVGVGLGLLLLWGLSRSDDDDA